MGQFSSKDPSGLNGGDANLRRYAGNDPADFVDPSGRGVFAYAGGVAGAAAGTSIGTALGTWIDSTLGTSPAASDALGQAGGEAGLAAGRAVGQKIDDTLGTGGSGGGAGSSGGGADGSGGGGGEPGGGGGEPGGGGGEPGGGGGEPGGGGGEPGGGGGEPGGGGGEPGGGSGAGGGGSGAGGAGGQAPGGGGGGASAYGESHNEHSVDPNALLGPAGWGTQNFLQPTGSWSYTVDFENDGSVAAQDVTVTEQLDPSLNWSTFQLGSFGFGPIKVTIPSGLTQYQTTVAYQNADGTSLNVQVALDFNVQSGLLTVTFTSLDPLTGQAPSGVFDGFLPPDNSSGVGEGYVQYTVQPKSGLTTGTTINQQASVVFDTNAPLDTAAVVNTIDVATPTSSVSPLPSSESSPSFPVSWSGSDGAGSGIASYNVYVSEDGGAFEPFLTDTTTTSATFTGAAGHTYSFISVATSNTGITQPEPSVGQATTEILAPPSQPAPPVLVAADDSGTEGDNITDDDTPAFSGTTQADATVQLLNGTNVIGTATADAGGNYVVPVQSPLSPGTYQITVVASNAGAPARRVTRFH